MNRNTKIIPHRDYFLHFLYTTQKKYIITKITINQKILFKIKANSHQINISPHRKSQIVPEIIIRQFSNFEKGNHQFP